MKKLSIFFHFIVFSGAMVGVSALAGDRPEEPMVTVVSPSRSVWKPFGEYFIDKRLGHKMPGFGVFRCVDSHPQNPDMVVMGGDTTGIWKSSDAGKSWDFASKNLPFDQVYSVRFCLAKPSVVWAFTCKGVVISRDAGDSWSFTALSRADDLDGRMHGLLAVSPQNAETAIAYVDKKVQRTVDGGKSWTTVIDNILVRDLEFHPKNGNFVYVAGGEAGKGDRLSVMVSNNGGASFKAVGPPMVFQAVHRASLAVSAAQPDSLWMMVFGDRKVQTSEGEKKAMFGGFFRSLDCGAHFAAIAQPGEFKPQPDGMLASPPSWPINEEKKGYDAKKDTSFMRMSLAQIGWDHALTVSDTNPNLIVAGGIGPIFSRDGGKSWAFGPEGEAVHSDIQDAVLRGERLWIVSDGGLNRVDLSNGKMVSYQIDGYGGQQFWGFGTSFKTGVAAFGINHSTIKVHDPKIYQGLYSAGGADAQTTFVNLFDDQWVYGTPWWNEVIRRPMNLTEKPPWRRSCVDFGYVPFRTPEPHPNLAYSFFALHKETAPNDPHRTVAQQVARTDDNFHTHSTLWRKEGITARRLRVCITHPDTMVVISGPDNKVERTDDAGKTWIDITPKEIKGRYNDVAIDEDDPEELWLAQSGYHTKSMVLRSHDGGKSWSDYAQGLDGAEAQTMEIQRGTRGGIYLGCRPGVWFRNNDMEAWVRYDHGLPYTRVSFLQIDYAARVIRAGTNQGAWQAPLAQDFAPQAVIAASHHEVTPSTNRVKFYCHSALPAAGSTWKWTFAGGTPAESTAENPMVTYDGSKSESYDVTLTVTDAKGRSSSQTLSKWIRTGATDAEIGKLKEVLLSLADPDERFGADQSKYLCRKLADQSEPDFDRAEAERSDAKRRARWDSFSEQGDDDALRFERPEPVSQ